MVDSEIKPRIISNTWVNGPVQLPERAFEHPLPLGTYGIKVFNGGIPEVDVLDKEVEIYSQGFAGDQVPRRLAAVLSEKDGRKLLSSLHTSLTTLPIDLSLSLPMLTRGSYNPDDYPCARIIKEPDVVAVSMKIQDIEQPFPQGIEELRFPLIIRGVSPVSQEKTPLLLITRYEALNLYQQLEKVLKSGNFRGFGAVSVERELVLPKRLVRFEGGEFHAA